MDRCALGLDLDAVEEGGIGGPALVLRPARQGYGVHGEGGGAVPVYLDGLLGVLADLDLLPVGDAVLKHAQLVDRDGHVGGHGAGRAVL